MTTELKTQIKSYWQDGDRQSAFMLYLMESCPDTWIRYASKTPQLTPRLESLASISEFKEILRELIRSTSGG
jgi:hypothetical protein